ncbi:hypothetical protein PH210_09950 [Paenibacillus sp. BSR1-1]|uniref:hypothetical protein n=1 Tax=Paenibacillus sp. BSR1-1 TaxID=3020845 RepID=UPI0025B0C3E2|nr:hypothetical protein [Paenibacillus sp. BSR1-1]MDN3016512.1 hypothetical protein [Paenibacillus sp. BSR1-1]
MIKAFAVEANSEIADFPEFHDLLFEETNINWNVRNFFIYLIDEEANLAQELLKAAELFEHIHPLFVVANGKKSTTFEDYALELDVDHCGLFASDIIPFCITKGNQNDIQMAMYQFEEHLVFETRENGSALFFIDKNNIELIHKIARAYDIVVTFALDK